MPKVKKESTEPIDLPVADFPRHNENEIVVSDKKEKVAKKAIKFEDEEEGGENESGGLLSNIFNQRERLKSIYLQRPQLAKLKAPKEVGEVDGLSDDEVKARIAVCEAQLANETSGSVAEAVLFGVSTALDKFLHLDGRLVQRNNNDESLKASIKTVLGSRLFVYLSEEVKLGALFGLNTVSAINERKQDEMLRLQASQLMSNKENSVAPAATVLENKNEAPPPVVDAQKEMESILSADPNKIF